MLSIVTPTIQKTQRLNLILSLVNNIKDKALFIHDGVTGTTENIPVFPVLNLWSLWNNVILYSTFSDFIFVNKLATNHKRIFLLHDLNWHVDSINYRFTIKALKENDYLICRSEDHIKKINEMVDKKVLLLKDIDLERMINEISQETK